MISRRGFLGTLAAVALAPLVALKPKAGKLYLDTEGPDGPILFDGYHRYQAWHMMYGEFPTLVTHEGKACGWCEPGDWCLEHYKNGKLVGTEALCASSIKYRLRISDYRGRDLLDITDKWNHTQMAWIKTWKGALPKQGTLHGHGAATFTDINRHTIYNWSESRITRLGCGFYVR